MNELEKRVEILEANLKSLTAAHHRLLEHYQQFIATTVAYLKENESENCE
tara:strand:- start:995 stop:1144 length:150 start_codon:yes stop_codon:yes gene_type:complete